MNKILPEGAESVAESAPLEVTKVNRAAMVKKAKDLLSGPTEVNDLFNALEQHYVASNKHYTSDQLMDIVIQVKSDLAPEPELEAEEEVE